MAKYIVRVRNNSLCGWQTVLPESRENLSKQIRKYFGDNTYGSKDKAYNAALRYRNKELKRLGLSDLLKIKRFDRPDKICSNQWIKAIEDRSDT